MPPVSVLIKPASSLCNMSCDYCFYCDEAKNRLKDSYGFMSEKTLKNVIRKTMLNAEGYVSYLFQGGEPTLCGLEFYKKIIEYQKQYNRNGIKVYNSLQTNGYLIDERWCEFFKKENFLIGLSVDGTKDIHNTLRHDKAGSGTYERVLKASKLFDRYGVEYNILTVVSSLIAENIKQVYKDYGKRGWKYQQYILCLDPIDRKEAADYSVSAEKYGQFLIDLFEMWYEDFKRGTQPYIREFDNYLNILRGYLPEACSMVGHCTVQNVVEADGSVYPCDFYVLDNYYMGNYNTDKFTEVINSENAGRFVKDSLQLMEDCSECQYFKLCRGGCRRNRIDGRNMFCESYKMFFEECLDRMQKIVN